MGRELRVRVNSLHLLICWDRLDLDLLATAHCSFQLWRGLTIFTFPLRSVAHCRSLLPAVVRSFGEACPHSRSVVQAFLSLTLHASAMQVGEYCIYADFDVPLTTPAMLLDITRWQDTIVGRILICQLLVGQDALIHELKPDRQTSYI